MTMNIDNLNFDSGNKSQDIQGVSKPQTAQESTSLGNSQRFDELLESLQRIRLTGEAGEDPETKMMDFGKALEKADQAHRTVMDLSRQLESAYRKALGDQP